MLITAAVFQATMLPYIVTAVVGLVSHAVTAVPMLALVMAVRELVGDGVGAGVGPQTTPTLTHTS